MNNKKNKFSEKYKKELSNKLLHSTENYESEFREMLEKADIDTSEINIVNRTKFIVQYIPDVMEELIEKYGTFKVLMDDEKIEQEAIELIEKKFHEDLNKKKVETWNIYYLLLYCKINETIDINDNVELIPYGCWPCSDYFEIIDKIFNKLGPPATRSSEKNMGNNKEYIKEKFCEKNPVSLLIIKNVNANTQSEVYEMTKKIAGDIILCLSKLTNSSIEQKGWVVEGKMDGFKQIIPTVNFEHYHPHRMESVEKSKEIINRILHNLDKNHLLKLALKYEKEALSEDDPEFALIKRWSALEFIAEECATKNSNEKLLSKTDINTITKSIKDILTAKVDFSNNKIENKIEDKIKSSIGQINNKNAKEKVRDLLEYANYTVCKLTDTEKDLIDVIYQHRNCLTHLGGCNKYYSNVKECPARYCRESEVELTKLNFELRLMLLHVVGKFIDVKFQFKMETSDDNEIF